MRSTTGALFTLCVSVLLPMLGCGGGSSPVSQNQSPPPPPLYTFADLHSFSGGTDGGFSRAGVVLDSEDNLYGTTAGGNAAGLGTVFQVTASGTETTIFDFTGQGDVGDTLYGGVTLDPEGNLYGSTFFLGAFGSDQATGAGTVFQLTVSGQETTLYTFPNPGDIGNPLGGVVRDASGNLYGITFGSECTPAIGCGAVFEVLPTGEETTLHIFGLTVGDGSNPIAAPLLVGGVLYGTTSGGGSLGNGTVYSLDLSSGVETVIYSFAGSEDGQYPGYGALIQDSAGELYGTTMNGGSKDCGTVFMVTPTTGAETVLYNFQCAADGENPYGGLVQDAEGNLYGTAYKAGNEGAGTVFKLTTSGQFTQIYSFSGSDGENPWGTLALDASGNLYGTTNAGGANGYGNVFKLTPNQ